ncbi:MAG: hypothetical protein U0263_23620 [Polyangiaceae bacterium]
MAGRWRVRGCSGAVLCLSLVYLSCSAEDSSGTGGRKDAGATGGESGTASGGAGAGGTSGGGFR